MTEECPNPHDQLLEEVMAAVRRFLVSVTGRPSELPSEQESKLLPEQAALMALLTENPSAVTNAIESLPREGLIVLQNFGRMAFEGLVGRMINDLERQRRAIEHRKMQQGAPQTVDRSDVLSDARLKLLNKLALDWPRFDDPSKFDAYFRRIVNNCLYDNSKEERRQNHPGVNREEILENIHDDSETPSNFLVSQEERDRDRLWFLNFEEKINKLPIVERAAITLRLYHTWTFPDLGELCIEDGPSPDAIRKAAERLFNKAKVEVTKSGDPPKSPKG